MKNSVRTSRQSSKASISTRFTSCGGSLRKYANDSGAQRNDCGLTSRDKSSSTSRACSPGKAEENSPGVRTKEKEASPENSNASSEGASTERTQETQTDQVLRSRSLAQSSGIMAKPVSVVVPNDGDQAALITPDGLVGDRPQGSGAASAARKAKKRRFETIPSGSSSSTKVKDSREGSSGMQPEERALIWRKIRAKDCALPDLDRMLDREAYTRMAIANARARLDAFPYKEEIAAQLLTIQKFCVELEAACAKGQESSSEIQILKEKLDRVEQEKLAAQGDVEAVWEKCKRILKDRNAAIRKESSRARRSLLEEYGIVLDKVREKLQKKKEETTAEVALQEKETDCDVDYGAAAVLDSSLGRIELPEVSSDSVNQDFGDATDQVDS
ncbi:hypothetical protein Bca101_067336 [Brassica carinata]